MTRRLGLSISHLLVGAFVSSLLALACSTMPESQTADALSDPGAYAGEKTRALKALRRQEVLSAAQEALVLEQMKNLDPQIRREAALTLGEAGSEQAIELLESLKAGESDPEVREAIIKAVSRVPRHNASESAELFFFPSKQEALQKILAQSGFGDEMEKLESEEAEERLYAVKAIRLSGRKDQLGALRYAMADEDDPLVEAEIKQTLIALTATPRPTPRPTPVPTPVVTPIPTPIPTPEATPIPQVAMAKPSAQSASKVSPKVESTTPQPKRPADKDLVAAQDLPTVGVEVADELPVYPPKTVAVPEKAKAAPTIASAASPSKKRPESKTVNPTPLASAKPEVKSSPDVLPWRKLTTPERVNPEIASPLLKPVPLRASTPNPSPVPSEKQVAAVSPTPKAQKKSKFRLWPFSHKKTELLAKGKTPEPKTEIPQKKISPPTQRPENKAVAAAQKKLDVLPVNVAPPKVLASAALPAKPSLAPTPASAIKAPAPPTVSSLAAAARTPAPKVSPLQSASLAPKTVQASVKPAGVPLPILSSSKKPAVGASVKILKSSIEPRKALPGQVVELRMAYELSGLPAGATAELIDERSISYLGKTSPLKPTSIERENGRWSYRGVITLPPTLKPGEYTITCRLLCNGQQDETRLGLNVVEPTPGAGEKTS